LALRTWKSCAEEAIALYRCCQLFKAEEVFVESVRRARNEEAAPEELAQALNNLAIGYIARAKFQDAENAIREATTLVQGAATEPLRVQAALTKLIRTQLLLEQERYFDAKLEATLTLQELGSELEFCSAEFWLNLARAFIGLGELAKASDAIDNFLRTSPLSATGSYSIFIDPIVGFAYFGPGWTAESLLKDAGPIEAQIRSLLLRSSLSNLLPSRARKYIEEALTQGAMLGDHYLTAQAYLAASRLAFGSNDWAEAARHCRSSLEIAERVYGASHPGLSAFLLNTASLTLMTDGLPDCVPLIHRTLDLLNNHFGPRHPKFARCQLMWCGLLPFIDGENKELTVSQEKLLSEALDTFIDFFDDTHSLVLAAKVQMAELLIKTDRLDEARALLMETLKDATALGTSNPYPLVGCLSELLKLSEVLVDSDRYRIWDFIHSTIELIDMDALDPSRQVDLMRHLAFLYQKTGDLEQPEILLLRAFELSKALDFDLHRRCKQDLVTLFIETRNFDAALEFLQESSEELTLQQQLRDNVQLAEVYRALDRVHDAEHLALGSLSQAEQLLPDCSDAFLQYVGILTDMYITQNRLEEAVRMVGILSSQKEHLGAPAKDIIPLSLRVIAEAFAQQNDQRAEKFFVQAINCAEEIVGKAPETMDACLVSFAEFCLGTGQVEKAQKLYLRSLDLRREICGEDSYPCALAMFNVAELSIDLDLDKALSLSKRALEIVDTEENANEDYLVAALRLRAVILDRSQQKAEALQLLDRARRLEEKSSKRKKQSSEITSAQEP